MTCLVAASVFDMQYRRIPNEFVVWSLINGVFLRFWVLGRGAVFTGIVYAFLTALPFYLFGAVGAGDVKVFMVIGMFLEFRMILIFGLISLIVTVCYGLVVRLSCRRQRLTRVPMAPGFLAGAGILYLLGGFL